MKNKRSPNETKYVLKKHGSKSQHYEVQKFVLSPLYNMFQLAFYACWNFVKYLKMKIFKGANTIKRGTWCVDNG